MTFGYFKNPWDFPLPRFTQWVNLLTPWKSARPPPKSPQASGRRIFQAPLGSCHLLGDGLHTPHGVASQRWWSLGVHWGQVAVIFRIFVGVCFWDHHLMHLSLSGCLCCLICFLCICRFQRDESRTGNPEDQTEAEDPNAKNSLVKWDHFPNLKENVWSRIPLAIKPKHQTCITTQHAAASHHLFMTAGPLLLGYPATEQWLQWCLMNSSKRT